MSAIKTIYRDIEIEYDEYNNNWRCVLANNYNEKNSLADLKKKIDEWHKKQFERIECICINTGGWRSDQFGTIKTITSIAEDGGVWVVNANGKREKKSSKSAYDELVLNNEPNKKLLEDFKAQMRIVYDEQKKANAILASMERATKKPEEKD